LKIYRIVFFTLFIIVISTYAFCETIRGNFQLLSSYESVGFSTERTAAYNSYYVHLNADFPLDSLGNTAFCGFETTKNVNNYYEDHIESAGIKTELLGMATIFGLQRLQYGANFDYFAKSLRHRYWNWGLLLDVPIIGIKTSKNLTDNIDIDLFAGSSHYKNKSLGGALNYATTSGNFTALAAYEDMDFIYRDRPLHLGFCFRKNVLKGAIQGLYAMHHYPGHYAVIDEKKISYLFGAISQNFPNLLFDASFFLDKYDGAKTGLEEIYEYYLNIGKQLSGNFTISVSDTYIDNREKYDNHEIRVELKKFITDESLIKFDVTSILPDTGETIWRCGLETVIIF
jgi:hypothetical protein